MSSWSTRFVSLGLAALLAGCAGAPPSEPAPALRAPLAPSAAEPVHAGAAVPMAERPAAAAASGTAAGAAGAAPAAQPAPVPPRAAAEYATALDLMKKGNTTDAELELKQLAIAYPEYAGPELNLGILYLHGSRLNEAEAAFKSALARNPGSAIAGDELGVVLRKLGNFSAAESAYQGAIAVDPNYAPAHLNLGILYDLYLGRPEKALEQYERYLAIAGDNKQVAGWVIEVRKRIGAPAPKKEAT